MRNYWPRENDRELVLRASQTGLVSILCRAPLDWERMWNRPRSEEMFYVTWATGTWNILISFAWNFWYQARFRYWPRATEWKMQKYLGWDKSGDAKTRRGADHHRWVTTATRMEKWRGGSLNNDWGKRTSADRWSGPWTSRCTIDTVVPSHDSSMVWHDVCYGE